MAGFAAGAIFSSLVSIGVEPFKGNILRTWDFEATKALVLGGKVDFPTDPPQIISNYVGGLLSEGAARQGLACFGYDFGPKDPGFFQHIDRIEVGEEAMMGFVGVLNQFLTPKKLSPIETEAWHAAELPKGGDVLDLLNRGNINETTAKYLLRRQGIRDYTAQDLVLSLRNEIPPVADLIRFAVRDAFYPDIVADYGEANEYPSIIDRFIRWQGLGWDTGYMAPDSVDADGNKVPAHPASWGEIAWFAHWEFPSWSQGQEMMFRLYTDSQYGPSPYVLNEHGEIDKDRTFDSKDLNRLLRASGYSAYWRNKLQLIAEPPLSRVDVRRMHQIGVLSEADVYHNYRAQGYGDVNAKRLTEFTIAKERPDVAKEACELFTLGLIDEEGYKQILKNANFADMEVTNALQKCKYDQSVKEATQALKYIHSSRIDGAIDNDQARAALSQLGINAKRIEEYLTQWKAEIQFGERQIRLSKLMGWFVEGILTYDQLVGRLQRLNYSDKDINFLMKEAVQKQVSYQNRLKRSEQKEADSEQAKQDKASRQSKAAMDKASKAQLKQQQAVQKQQQKLLSAEQKQLQSTLKAQEKAVKQATAALSKTSTDKHLIDYWKQGLITLPEVYMRLAVRGFNQADAERWVETYLVKGVKP